MEALMKGDIIVLNFPFSDLSGSKRRPALVAANLSGNDLIVCQITGESRPDEYAINLMESDFSKGSLKGSSTIRTNKIFTANKSIIIYKIGSLKNQKTKQVEKELIKIFSS